ncbi:tRNA-modifying protein YgfZ [Buchnera aphidicola (Thelaxes suberi)]|uniref:CAF17-like 4Fe-4S cluster assembly/insertion protein YgfZ n=1 Tax=Buchnera aphidicola TaxID=9 RepID=UPI003464BC22
MIKKFDEIKNYNTVVDCTHLTDWSCVSVQGIESKNFLQNMLSINIKNIHNNTYMIGSHCNIYGKVISILIIFPFQKGYAYIQRKSVTEYQINELKRYAMFSKVNISEETNYFILGIQGYTDQQIYSCFKIKVTNTKDSINIFEYGMILRLERKKNRFLILIKKNKLYNFNIKIKSCNEKILNNIWLSYAIDSGFPIIDKKNCSKIIALHTNLESLKGIDFDKGCYYGQEAIARLKFKSKVKYSLFWLKSMTCILPVHQTTDFFYFQRKCVEYQENFNWLIAGKVLAVSFTKQNKIWIQCILKNNLDKKKIFRVEGLEKIYFKINKIF